MTLSTRTGFSNALESLLYTVLAGLPAKISTHNAASSAEAAAILPGPYTVPAGGATMVASLNGAAELTGTIAEGSYTAAQLAAAVDADVNLSTVFEGLSFWNDTFFALKDSALGSAGKIKIGEGTINSILGWKYDAQYQWEPLDSIAWAKIQHPDLDDDIYAYPAIRIWGENEIDPTKGGEDVLYRPVLRLYDWWFGTSADVMSLFADQLLAMADLIVEVIYENKRLGGGADGHRITAVVPSEEVQIVQTEGWYRAYVDIFLEINVEEDLQC